MNPYHPEVTAFVEGERFAMICRGGKAMDIMPPCHGVSALPGRKGRKACLECAERLGMG